MAESVGGFFASLSLLSDESSFRRGESNLQGIANILKGFALIKIGKEVLNFIDKLAELNEVQAKMNITALEANTTTDVLQKWASVYEEVGDKGTEAGEALKKLSSVVADLGRGISPQNQGMVDMFAILGIKQDQWTKMSSSDLLRATIENAVAKIRAGANPTTVMNALRNVSGQGAVDIAGISAKSGVPVSKMLSDAGKGDFVSTMDRFNAMFSMMDWNKIATTIDSMKSLFATKFMAAIDPALKDFFKWLVDHKKDLEELISSLATNFGLLAKNIAEISLPILSGFLKTMNIFFASANLLKVWGKEGPEKQKAWEAYQEAWHTVAPMTFESQKADDARILALAKQLGGSSPGAYPSGGLPNIANPFSVNIVVTNKSGQPLSFEVTNPMSVGPNSPNVTGKTR